MSKYIDFNLIGDLVDSHGNVHYEDLKRIPKANVSDVRKGVWFSDDGCMTICSECYGLGCGSRYCPNCGAKMSGG